MTISDWFSVGALLIAALTAGGGWIVARRLTDRSDKIQERLAAVEEERRADERQERDEGQARLVSCWIEERVETFEDSDDPPLVAVCRNGSNEPVTDVLLMVGDDWVMTNTDNTYVGTLPPGATREVDVTIDLHPEMMASPPVEMKFIDAHSRSWKRDANGQLVPAPDYEAGAC